MRAFAQERQGLRRFLRIGEQTRLVLLDDKPDQHGRPFPTPHRHARVAQGFVQGVLVEPDHKAQFRCRRRAKRGWRRPDFLVAVFPHKPLRPVQQRRQRRVPQHLALACELHQSQPQAGAKSRPPGGRRLVRHHGFRLIQPRHPDRAGERGIQTAEATENDERFFHAFILWEIGKPRGRSRAGGIAARGLPLYHCTL